MAWYLLVGGCAAALGLLLNAILRLPRSNRHSRRVGAITLGFGIALLTTELWFALFFVESDGFRFTIAARRWFQRHWHPTNSLGFRDVEHSPASLVGQRIALVVGDSFVAGHGVEDAHDRFPDRLGQRLGPAWTVIQIAKPGWHTEDESAALASHPLPPPLRPDVVVLAWYVNDIEGASNALGKARPTLVAPPVWPLRRLVETSHLANFVYWRLYRVRFTDMGQSYFDHLVACYADDRIRERHADSLRGLARTARERGGPQVKVIAVLFPMLSDVDRTRDFTAWAARILEDTGADVLDLSPALAGRDPNTLVVSAIDRHPNQRLHDEVAARLWERPAFHPR